MRCYLSRKSARSVPDCRSYRRSDEISSIESVSRGCPRSGRRTGRTTAPRDPGHLLVASREHDLPPHIVGVLEEHGVVAVPVLRVLPCLVHDPGLRLRHGGHCVDDVP